MFLLILACLLLPKPDQDSHLYRTLTQCHFTDDGLMYEESDEDVEGEDGEAASRRDARRRLKKETEVCHTTGFLGLTSTLVSCRCVDCADA